MFCSVCRKCTTTIIQQSRYDKISKLDYKMSSTKMSSAESARLLERGRNMSEEEKDKHIIRLEKTIFRLFEENHQKDVEIRRLCGILSSFYSRDAYIERLREDLASKDAVIERLRQWETIRESQVAEIESLRAGAEVHAVMMLDLRGQLARSQLAVANGQPEDDGKHYSVQVHKELDGDTFGKGCILVIPGRKSAPVIGLTYHQTLLWLHERLRVLAERAMVAHRDRNIVAVFTFAEVRNTWVDFVAPQELNDIYQIALVRGLEVLDVHLGYDGFARPREIVDFHANWEQQGLQTSVQVYQKHQGRGYIPQHAFVMQHMTHVVMP